jgi:hypothetical protein
MRGPNGAGGEFLMAASVQNLRKLANLIPEPTHHCGAAHADRYSVSDKVMVHDRIEATCGSTSR